MESETVGAVTPQRAQKKIHVWQISYLLGLLIVVPVLLLEFLGFHLPEAVVPYTELFGGILLKAGACEAFVLSVEGIAHNMHLTDYVSGIYASLASTIPELSLITFLLLGGQYEMAWILALATIFMNSFVFAVYTLVLPKDEHGEFKLPDAIHWVGSDLLSMGAVISLSVGLSMVLVHMFTPPEGGEFAQYLDSGELLVFGICLVVVFIAYLYRITKYYGRCDPKAEDPYLACEIKHTQLSKGMVAVYLLLASLGALLGGEALSSFAHFAIAPGGLTSGGLTIIQAALLLVVFGGTPEYIIVGSSHRKNEIEIALSNAFGGIVQVFFVVFGFTLVTSGIIGFFMMGGVNLIPIDVFSVVLLLFAFPTLFILRVMITDDSKVNALESITMIAVFVMMLYILLVYGGY
jgi:Ca2+/Na+ antiporter